MTQYDEATCLAVITEVREAMKDHLWHESTLLVSDLITRKPHYESVSAFIEEFLWEAALFMNRETHTFLLLQLLTRHSAAAAERLLRTYITHWESTTQDTSDTVETLRCCLALAQHRAGDTADLRKTLRHAHSRLSIGQRIASPLLVFMYDLGRFEVHWADERYGPAFEAGALLLSGSNLQYAESILDVHDTYMRVAVAGVLSPKVIDFEPIAAILERKPERSQADEALLDLLRSVACGDLQRAAERLPQCGPIVQSETSQKIIAKKIAVLQALQTPDAPQDSASMEVLLEALEHGALPSGTLDGVSNTLNTSGAYFTHTDETPTLQQLMAAVQKAESEL